MTDIKFEDPEQKEFDLKMSKTIEAMPAEVKDRFKALKVLHDQQTEIDEEEQKLYRDLELKYDKLYQEIYEQRKSLLSGAVPPSEALLAEYATRATELDDEDYKKVEATPIDVKDIQNTPLGVYGFWFKAMLNHGLMSRLIHEKDRPILMHLQDVQCKLHEAGHGYDLVFTFEKNDYFSNETLKKSFVMTKSNIIEKCEGTPISWKDGKDVTQKKVKKKNKKKGKTTTVTKTVDCESFFNFFKTIEMPDEKALEGKKDDDEKDPEEEEKDVGELMDADFDIGNEFKDQLIPLALEYYMEVIQEEDEEDHDCSDDECGGGHGHDHSDEEFTIKESDYKIKRSRRNFNPNSLVQQLLAVNQQSQSQYICQNRNIEEDKSKGSSRKKSSSDDIEQNRHILKDKWRHIIDIYQSYNHEYDNCNIYGNRRQNIGSCEVSQNYDKIRQIDEEFNDFEEDFESFNNSCDSQEDRGGDRETAIQQKQNLPIGLNGNDLSFDGNLRGNNESSQDSDDEEEKNVNDEVKDDSDEEEYGIEYKKKIGSGSKAQNLKKKENSKGYNLRNKWDIINKIDWNKHDSDDDEDDSDFSPND